MSIIFNVAARKEESLIVMAAGSDPESNEEPVATGDANSCHQIATTATTTAHHNNHHHHHHHHSHYLGLPYQDHNYGAPPPPTPPQSPPHPKVNGFFDELSNHSNQSNNTETADENEDTSITRCICDFDHDDGYMICCDQCGVWQHVECMGLDRNHIPDSYFCEKCEPRNIDKLTAVALQSKKKEEMIGIDTSATDSGDEVTTTRYTAVSNSPTSLTLTTLKSKKVKRKKKRREKEDDEDKQNKDMTKKLKVKRDGSRKLRTEFVPLSEETMDSWDMEAVMCGDFMKNGDETMVNQYCADIQHILASHKHKSDDAAVIPNKQLPVRTSIFNQINKSRTGLQATEDIKTDQPLMEYISKVMLKEQFDAQNTFFKRPYPFVLFYNKFDNVEMCLDARSYGNDAKYVSRSCCPNAEVRHAVKDGNIYLYICSITDISKGCEISIGFDFNFKDCAYPVECVCHTENCPVVKHNSKCFENGALDGKKKKNHHKNNHILREEGDHSHTSRAAGPASSKSRKISPLRVSLGNHDNQNNQEPVPEPTETLENEVPIIPEPENEATKEQQEPEVETEPEHEHEQKKMTREERKMKAIMEAFKKMEKTEKRRQQALERIQAKAAKNETEKVVCEIKEEESKDLEQSVSSDMDVKSSVPPVPKPKQVKGRTSRRRSTAKRRRTNSATSSVTTLLLDPSSPEPSVCSTPLTPAPPSTLSDNSLASPTSSSKTFRFPKTKKVIFLHH
uniref:Histone-lysine N-methyltransferase 2E-like n=1 Tax=Saccoglossus kowalevskii TaxID=10224 RepID=A0ABM0MWH2_SACKO|nr:PREDICTED: histone-lysine N-methyltransferase 2E-like [Saccoglossus kowalevskii]